MENLPSEDKIQKINFYKILFNKHDTIPVGRFSRNLNTKIKNKQNEISTYKEKNMEYFNPISEDNMYKILKLYSHFHRNKSANKFLDKNKFKQMDKILSRPLSQYSTIIDLSKNIYNENSQKNFPFRPISQDERNSNLIFDKFLNNISPTPKEKQKIQNMKQFNKKREDNISKFYIKKNILKKKQLLQRNVSAKYFYPKKDLTIQPNVKTLLQQEKELKRKKKMLKGRLLSAISKHIIINNETFKHYDLIYKNEKEEKKNENDISENISKKNIYDKNFHYSNHNSYCFSNIRPPFRYEDTYFSPMELLQKFFTREEIIILKSSPAYFGLNKFPFKTDVKFNPTLLSKFDVEDNKYNFNESLPVNKPKKKRIIFDLKKEMQKIKKVFKEKKIKKRKREPIKGKDFVSHYERDIEPDEGTVAYFDRKYLKYLSNKEKKMEKKINNLKFKKNRFEYLKNLRTQKIQEEKNIQRIATPYINIIKRNYLRSNNNINI